MEWRALRTIHPNGSLETSSLSGISLLPGTSVYPVTVANARWRQPSAVRWTNAVLEHLYSLVDAQRNAGNAPDFHEIARQVSEYEREMTREQHARENADAIARGDDVGEPNYAPERSPVECVRMYRRRPTEDRSPWTKEEDDRLRDGVARFGEVWAQGTRAPLSFPPHDLPLTSLRWRCAVATIVGRNPNQCITRWTKSLRPDIKRGRWSADEDQTLREAVSQQLGRSAVFDPPVPPAPGAPPLPKVRWSQVSKLVEGRTDAQCRERWVNVLDPRVSGSKRRPWTADEEERLWQMRERDGKTWAEISTQGFQGMRTDSHVMRKYQDLAKKRGGGLRPGRTRMEGVARGSSRGSGARGRGSTRGRGAARGGAVPAAPPIAPPPTTGAGPSGFRPILPRPSGPSGDLSLASNGDVMVMDQPLDQSVINQNLHEGLQGLHAAAAAAALGGADDDEDDDVDDGGDAEMHDVQVNDIHIE